MIRNEGSFCEATVFTEAERAALDLTEQVQRLLPRQGRPQGCLAGTVRQPPVRLDRVALAVESEDLRPPRRGLHEPEQQPDGGGLPGPVGAEVAQDLALGDVQMQVDEGLDPSEALRQPAHLEQERSHQRPVTLTSAENVSHSMAPSHAKISG